MPGTTSQNDIESAVAEAAGAWRQQPELSEQFRHIVTGGIPDGVSVMEAVEVFAQNLDKKIDSIPCLWMRVSEEVDRVLKMVPVYQPDWINSSHPGKIEDHLELSGRYNGIPVVVDRSVQEKYKIVFHCLNQYEVN